MNDGRLHLPPVTIHERIAALGASVKPWSIEKTGIRSLGFNRGEGVRVGVIDTGIDPDHRREGDLAHAVAMAKDFTGSRFGADDQHGHGTHVAGTIAGREWGDGAGKSGAGVAPGCKLYIAKGLGDDGTGRDDQIAAALYWLRENRCDIVNMSLGSSRESPVISLAIRELVGTGVVVVCAAGNAGDNSRSWPAMDHRTVSVGATDENERPANFSEPSNVNVAAPGVKILSCYRFGQYGVLSGTSMAAPFFSGFLAVHFGQVLKRGGPLPKPADIPALIAGWTKDIHTPGKDSKTGSGLVSVEKYANAWRESHPDVVPVSKAINLGLFKVYIPARAGDALSVGK